MAFPPRFFFTQYRLQSDNRKLGYSPTPTIRQEAAADRHIEVPRLDGLRQFHVRHIPDVDRDRRRDRGRRDRHIPRGDGRHVPGGRARGHGVCGRWVAAPVEVQGADRLGRLEVDDHELRRVRVGLPGRRVAAVDRGERVLPRDD